VTDSVLFEGGGLENFVAERGLLLPDDERMLAQQWLLAERSVHEVEKVRRGESIDVLDLRTGDRHEVREPTASRHLNAGDLVCARVLPASDTTQPGGVESVAPRQQGDQLDRVESGPDAIELIAFLTGRLAPQSLENASP
jgi:hypothetical protein